MAEADGKRLVARDAGGAPLFSEFDWTEDATARIQRVPAGFMRERTQARVEELAQEQGSTQIDLECVEAGIELGMQLMADLISQNDTDSGGRARRGRRVPRRAQARLRDEHQPGGATERGEPDDRAGGHPNAPHPARGVR